MYINGEGVSQDNKEAVKWITKAAEQGYAAAQKDLGISYENGIGVPQDYNQAIEWYTKAAEQGYAAAQNNLGMMHVNGDGVLKDSVEAYAWSILAEKNGDSRLKEYLDGILTADQIAAGQVRAKEMEKEMEK
jgi:TPR repeat protein